MARGTFLESFADVIPAADILARADEEDSPQGIAALLSGGGAAWLASVEATGAPVGFALLRAPQLPEVETFADDLELKRIYLFHRFQGGGTGLRLLRTAEAEARRRAARRLLLGVHKENDAVSWYRRQGFAVIGERAFRVGTQYFGDFIMAKAL